MSTRHLDFRVDTFFPNYNSDSYNIALYGSYLLKQSLYDANDFYLSQILEQWLRIRRVIYFFIFMSLQNQRQADNRR